MKTRILLAAAFLLSCFPESSSGQGVEAVTKNDSFHAQPNVVQNGPVDYSANAFLTEGVVRNFGNAAGRVPILDGSGRLLKAQMASTTAYTDAAQTFTQPQTFSSTINKITFTAPATAATITIANGKTFTANNSIALAGVDGKALTVNNSLVLAGTDNKTLTLTGGLTIGADTSITGGGTLALGNFTLTVPATGTAALLGVANAFTNTNTFSTSISSASFASGFTGSGWRVDYGITNASRASAEFDDLTVRGRMRVYELLINQIRATNGSLFVSSSGKVQSATGAGPYTITTDGDHGFAVGDVIRAQRFTGTGTYTSNMNVTAVGSTTAFTATLATGSAPPAAGYEYVRLGNASDTSRQGGLYLTADDSNAPYMDIVDGVTSHADWSAFSKLKVRIGRLTGINAAPWGQLSGYGLWSDNVYLTGAINATSGKIGFWNLTSAILAGGAGNYANANTPFYADHVGKFSLGDKLSFDGTTLAINGNITANTGNIGGWAIGANSISSNGIRLQSQGGSTIAGIFVGPGTFQAANTPFYVDYNGSLSLGDKFSWNATTNTLVVNGGGTFSGALIAATGSFKGELTAASGTFAGSLTAGSGTISGNLNVTGGGIITAGSAKLTPSGLELLAADSIPRYNDSTAINYRTSVNGFVSSISAAQGSGVGNVARLDLLVQKNSIPGGSGQINFITRESNGTTETGRVSVAGGRISLGEANFIASMPEAAFSFGHQLVGNTGMQWMPSDGITFKHAATGLAGEKGRIFADGHASFTRYTQLNYFALGTSASNARNHFVQYNNGGQNPAQVGWIAAAFGDTAGARVVIGQYATKAIIGGHNADLNAWADLYINDGGGNVHIPSGTLYVQGTAYTSETRLKQNIQPWRPMDPDAMQKLSTQSFQYKATPDQDEAGLLVEDVEPILPEAVVDTGNEGRKAIKQTVLNVMTIDELQYLQQQIDALRGSQPKLARRAKPAVPARNPGPREKPTPTAPPKIAPAPAPDRG